MLRKAELQRLLNHVSHTRHPERDRVMVLLSFKAGLRAKEISRLTWSMVTDATGGLVESISLPNKASKGKGGGRTIPLHNDLRAALASLKAVRGTALSSGRVQRTRGRLQRQRGCGLVFDSVPRDRDRRRVIALGAEVVHHGGGKKDNGGRR